MEYFHLLILSISLLLFPFSDGQTISRLEKQKFLEKVVNKILDLNMMDSLKLSETNKKKIEDNKKRGNGMLEGIPLPVEIDSKKLCTNLDEKMPKVLEEFGIGKDQNYYTIIKEYEILDDNDNDGKVKLAKVCQIIWAIENDEFNVKLSILEASKFFDRINHFEKTIIEIRDKNDICALFLYKKENGPILTIFNGLIGQLGKAEYVLKNEVAKAFGKEFNENERKNPQNCLFDMALMSALGRMVKLIIEIVKKSDMNSVKHNYFGGEKNKFCRIKENEKEHLNEYLTFSDIIDDWFRKNEEKYSLDKKIWYKFKNDWINGRMDISIEGMPPAKRVKSVSFNLAQKVQPMRDIMEEMKNIELPGKFDLNMGKMQSANFFSKMEKLRTFLWNAEELQNSCTEILYKNANAFKIYEELVNFNELNEIFPKVEDGIWKAMKFQLNLAKRTAPENCLYDFIFIRVLIEITRSIIHVVLHSEDENLKEEILCKTAKKYCREMAIKYDQNGEMRPRKTGIDILKGNYQLLRFAIDDWFANKQENDPENGLMNIWKKYFEKEWIEGKFFVHIEGIVLPNTGQKQLPNETNEIVKELMKKQKELPTVGNATDPQKMQVSNEEVDSNNDSNEGKNDEFENMFQFGRIKNSQYDEKRQPNKITGMLFVWTEWDEINANSPAEDQSNSFENYIPNNFILY